MANPAAGQIAGKVAIVTGGASGIGEACAETLAREGAAVVVTDVDELLGQGVVQKISKAGGKVAWLKHDVRDEAGWPAVIAEAEKRGIHETPVVKKQIELARLQLLSNATVQEREAEDAVMAFEQSAYYTKNLDQYSAVMLKMIQLPFANETEELQAKRRAVAAGITSRAVTSRMPTTFMAAATTRATSTISTTKRKICTVSPPLMSDSISETNTRHGLST